MDKMEITKRGPATIAALACFLCLSSGAARAEVAIAGKAGTLGAGAELTLGLARQWNVRLGLNGYSYSDRREASDIEYAGEAKLRTGTAWLDWHPGGGGFRLTGGLVYNDTTVEGSSLPPASGVYDAGAQHEADRAEPHHRDGVPVPHARDVDAVQAAGQGLGELGDLGREAGRNGEEVASCDALGDEQELRVRPVQEREQVLAERLLTALAGGARPARRGVRRDQPTPRRDVDPAQLVPERARKRPEQHRVAAPVRLEPRRTAPGHARRATTWAACRRRTRSASGRPRRRETAARTPRQPCSPRATDTRSTGRPARFRRW